MNEKWGDGARIREVRARQGKSLRVIAELAGISAGYLSRLERGERILDSRKLLYALADALQVAPSSLTGQPYAPADAYEASAQASAQALRAVLRDAEIGELADGHRALSDLEDDAARVDQATAASDYAEIGGAVPDLLRDLYARPNDDHDAARLLVRALHSAFYLSKDLGHGDLAWAVSGHLERAATRFGEPSWGAVAMFVRSHAVVGAHSRPRALTLAQRAAEIVTPDDGDAGQIYGMCHLSSALHAAATGDGATARAHLTEARDVADHTGDGRFAGLMFGPTNVGVWQLAVHLELGDIGRGLEAARGVDATAIPSAGRQATFFSDLGLALTKVRGQAEQAVRAIRRAEQLAPGRVHHRPTVRAAVVDLRQRTLPDSVEREVRGLAFRMRIGA